MYIHKKYEPKVFTCIYICLLFVHIHISNIDRMLQLLPRVRTRTYVEHILNTYVYEQEAKHILYTFYICLLFVHVCVQYMFYKNIL